MEIEKTNRRCGGNLRADPIKFPGGIKPLADYVHAKGLKLGIYLDRRTKTCDGYPGIYGHEIQDANQLASWQVNFLKYDNCTPVGNFVTDYEKMHFEFDSIWIPFYCRLVPGLLLLIG